MILLPSLAKGSNSSSSIPKNNERGLFLFTWGLFKLLVKKRGLKKKTRGLFFLLIGTRKKKDRNVRGG